MPEDQYSIIYDKKANLVFIEAPSLRMAFEALQAFADKEECHFISLAVDRVPDGKTSVIGTLGPLRAVLQDPFDGSQARVISNSLACTPF